MQKAFSGAEDRKAAIHLTAVAGAGIVASLPLGIDAWALRLAEVIMVICIAASYGEKLSKSAAKGIMLSSFAQLAGEAAAFTALEAAETAKVATVATGAGPVVAYGIKSGIAVTLIETIGHLVIAYYEKSGSIEAKVCKVVENIGFAADVTRAASVVVGFTDNLDTSTIDNSSESISFTGNSREGYSSGHSESYWKDYAKKAEKEGRSASYDFAEKRYKEAVEAREQFRSKRDTHDR